MVHLIRVKICRCWERAAPMSRFSNGKPMGPSGPCRWSQNARAQNSSVIGGHVLQLCSEVDLEGRRARRPALLLTRTGRCGVFMRVRVSAAQALEVKQ